MLWFSGLETEGIKLDYSEGLVPESFQESNDFKSLNLHIKI